MLGAQPVLACSQSELQSLVKQGVQSFVQKDARLPLLLERLHERGLRIFLLTNSAYDYTNVRVYITVLYYAYTTHNAAHSSCCTH